MRRSVLVSILLSELLIAAIGEALLFNFAAANPTPPAPPLKVDIISPQNGETVRTTLEVAFKYSKPLAAYSFHSYYYTLDGQEPIEFSPEQMGDIYCITLPILSNGEHDLTISVNARVAPEYSGYGGVSSPVRFTVDYVAPTVTVSPLENLSLTGKGAVFGFRVTDYSLSWVSYSLDGEENVTINNETLAQTKIGSTKTWSGNLSFTELSSGSHSLTVYAGNEVGCTGVSEPFSFTIAPDAEPVPLMLVAASASVAAVFILAVALLYFKKKRRVS